MYQLAGFTIKWERKGIDQIGIEEHRGDELVGIDCRYFRPTEVDYLIGNSGNAWKKIVWKATVTFEELIEMMVRDDLKETQREHLVKTGGLETYDNYEKTLLANCISMLTI